MDRDASDRLCRRRDVLRSGVAFTTAALLGHRAVRAAARAAESPPVRAITRGPKHHWFGYYDKLQFDPTSRFVLSGEVDFEHRTPRADDVIKVGMVDTASGDKWIEIGESRAWGWQQGCMLQWRPGTTSEVVWNDREAGRYVCRLLDVRTSRRQTISTPIYTLSPDGRFALSADFARIQIMRPGYGYVGLPDRHGEELAPKEYAGEWRCDTHPRASNDGRWVCIDSPHSGDGRQLHLIDIHGITR